MPISSNLDGGRWITSHEDSIIDSYRNSRNVIIYYRYLQKSKDIWTKSVWLSGPSKSEYYDNEGDILEDYAARGKKNCHSNLMAVSCVSLATWRRTNTPRKKTFLYQDVIQTNHLFNATWGSNSVFSFQQFTINKY